MQGFPRIQVQGDGAEPPPGIVDGVNADRAGRLRVVGDAREALLRRVGGGYEQRDALVGAVGGQVGQVAGGAFQQIHHLNGSIGGDAQPPLAGAVAKPPAQAGAARFKFLSREGAGFPGRQSQIDIPGGGRPCAAVVHACNRNLGAAAVGVDEAQLAHLVAVAAGVENRRQVQNFGLGSFAGHQIVHAGQEPVRGADIGQRFNVQVGFQLQPPIPLAAAGAAGQSLGRVARLQVIGVEVRRGFGAQGKPDRPGPPAGVVDRKDAHRAGFAGAVDDANEALLHLVGRRHEQRDLMRGRQRRLAAQRGNNGAQQP